VWRWAAGKITWVGHQRGRGGSNCKYSREESTDGIEAANRGKRKRKGPSLVVISRKGKMIVGRLGEDMAILFGLAGVLFSEREKKQGVLFKEGRCASGNCKKEGEDRYLRQLRPRQ